MYCIKVYSIHIQYFRLKPQHCRIPESDWSEDAASFSITAAQTTVPAAVFILMHQLQYIITAIVPPHSDGLVWQTLVSSYPS